MWREKGVLVAATIIIVTVIASLTVLIAVGKYSNVKDLLVLAGAAVNALVVLFAVRPKITDTHKEMHKINGGLNARVRQIIADVDKESGHAR